MKPRKPPNPQNNRSRKRAIAMYGAVVPMVNNSCVWSFISWNSIIGYIANNRESFDFITAHVHQSSRVLRSYIRQPQEAAQCRSVVDRSWELRFSIKMKEKCVAQVFSFTSLSRFHFFPFLWINIDTCFANILLAIYRVNYIIMLSLSEGGCWCKLEFIIHLEQNNNIIGICKIYYAKYYN